mgnify:CR=1 FL=1|nr:MAG TPA: chaperone [Caudoviricetes sp.]
MLHTILKFLASLFSALSRIGTKNMVKLLVERQRLTAAEYENVTGEPYTA